MKTSLENVRRRTGGAAFTILDAVLAMGIAAIMFTAFFAALGTGFDIIKMARENTRATQIMVEKMETIRLYTWEQLNDPTFIPSNFVTPYYPSGGAAGCGTLYTGRVDIAPCTLARNYAPEMRLVTVEINWLTGQLPRTRRVQTYVTRDGLQNYVY